MTIEPPLPDELFAGPYGVERRRMIQDHLWGRDIRDRRILEVMARVPRHEFIAAELAPAAYDDTPQNIGHGQTISQPYMVAKMGQLARVRPGDHVLEVGSGCGYQAAVLLELGARIFGLEILEPLMRDATARLTRLGYGNFQFHCRDGYDGLPEAAPFEAIILSAAPEEVPPPLLDQLAPGGRLVAPLGPPEAQQLFIFTLTGGQIERQCCFPVRFVPLTGRALLDSAACPRHG